MHRRQQIREAIRAVLDGVPGLHVAVTRTRPTQSDELPAAIIYTPTEVSEPDNMKGSLTRTVAAQIELRVASTDAVDDDLDAVCSPIENAMALDPSLGRIAQRSWLASTKIGFSGEGKERHGVAVLEYRVRYRTEPGAA